ncbi:VCBS domain-containing protein, partial [Mesorhizobium ciceri]|uniref:beta strand repeat-containing protein n=1 Tax=Mesorhizobium ciceri TaxID=39645 RepID=UPI00344DC809
TFTVTAADGTTQLVSFTIHGTNDAAVIGTPTVADVTEDTPNSAAVTLTAAGSISISDVDTGEDHFQTTVSGAGTNLGSLVLAANGSYTYSVANAAVQFLAGSDANGGTSTHVDTFTVTAADGTTQLVSFTIHGTNDAAVNGVPASQSTDSNTAKVFSSANGNAISISDVDNSSHTVTLTSSNGTLTLSGLAGLSFSVGDGSADGTMTFSGTDTAINAALNGLSFAPTNNFHGSASIQITTNDGSLSDTDTVNITVVDTVAPNAPVITSVTDDVSPVTATYGTSGVTTNDTDLTVKVTLPTSGSPAEAGDTIRLYNGTGTGIPLGGAYTLTAADIVSGFVSLQTGTLTNGTTYNLTARITDAATNQSAASNTFVVTEDTTAPSAPTALDLAAVDDSGSSSTDNITKNTSALTISGSGENGATVTLFVDANNNGIVDGGESLGTTTVSGGAFSLDVSLAQGTHNVRAIQTDVAGNASAASTSHALDITVDTTAPSAPTALDLAAVDDSGSSSTDNITKNTSALTISGSGENGATVTLFDDANNNGAQDGGEATLGTVTISSGTTFTTEIALAAGLHHVRAVQTDVAGNQSATSSAALDITVDTTAPTVSSVTFTKSGNNRTVTVVFSEAIVNFDSSDVTVSSGTVGTVTGSGTTWTVPVTNVSGNPVNFQVVSSGTGVSSWTDIAGNAGVGSAITDIHPAGVAGEPINLALTDPSADSNDLITLTVTGVPSGWSLNAGANNGDGTWTVQTNDVRSLAVTSSSGFAGAVVLNIAETWTNADGTIGTKFVADNVEAYAQGSPIFAWSGDDVLTGSSGNDLFVFSQPIGNDTVHSFDAAADKIDLIGYSGFASFADVQAHMADDGNGNAMITLADGQSITLDGVHSSALTGSNFVFDQTPVINNAGTMSIGDGALLPLSGTINNTGLISLDSAGNDTLLQLIQHGITLQGGGQIVLSDSDANMISGTAADVTLTNVDNTISGAGQLGGGLLGLNNQGTIIATGSHALVIDTGSSTVVNSGTLEATGSGGLAINGTVANSGLIWANGGDIAIGGQVTGNGDALIGNMSQLEFHAASSADVIFGVDAAGTLRLDDSFDFSGSIAGMTNDDKVDLGDIWFSTGTSAVYQANQDGSGGTLTVSDGTHDARLHIIGTYDPGSFTVADDGAGHTVVGYNPADDFHFV